jgi:hypothetical protein
MPPPTAVTTTGRAEAMREAFNVIATAAVYTLLILFVIGAILTILFMPVH